MSAFKRILKNASILAGGSIGASAIGLVSFALLARALSPELFGVLVLAQGYAMVVDRLINFQSWQALIKFGTVELEAGNTAQLKKLFQFGIILDVVSALLACLVGVFLPFLIGGWLGWDEQKTIIVSVFSLIIVFNIEGTPTAILRLYDRFAAFAKKDLLAAMVKLLLVGFGFYMSYGIWYFVVVSMLCMVLGYVYLLIAGLRELKAREISLFNSWGHFSQKQIKQTYPALWPFVWTTNFHGSVRMSTLRLDTIIIDATLGSAATGLYQVSKQFTRIFTQVSQPLYTSIYPELARLWAQKNISAFKSTIVRFMSMGFLFGIVVWLVFFFTGEFIIETAVGSEYLDSLGVTLWYMSAIVISVMAFPLTPALLAMGKAKASFNVLLVATIAYFAVVFPLLQVYGIVGAGISYLIFYIVWFVLMAVFYGSGLTKRNLPESTQEDHQTT